MPIVPSSSQPDAPAVALSRTARILTVSIVVWTFAVTLLRAVRPPNDFAEAHWLLDYRFGFVKRGLAGTLLSLATTLFGIRPTAQLIAAVSYGLFAAFGLMLIAVSLRLIARSGWSAASILVVLAFASSPFVVMSGHLVGYYDHIFIVLTMLSIALLLGGRVWTAGVLLSAAVLVHESAILIGFPLFVLTWLLRRQADRRPLPVWPLALPALTFLTIVVVQNTLMPAGFESAYKTHLLQFDFVQNNRSTMVSDSIGATFGRFFSASAFVDRVALTPSMHALVFPCVFAFLCFAIDRHDRPVWSLESLMLVGACVLPQLMHAFAWDTARIWTYSIACGFLAAWIYAEVQTTERPRAGFVALLALVAIVFNSVSSTPLMDNEPDRYTLATRVAVYLPAVAAACLLAVRDRRVPIDRAPAIESV